MAGGTGCSLRRALPAPYRRHESMKKFREVRYVDDGVTEYQCLACKGFMQVRCGLGQFCTQCGVRWEGQEQPSAASIRRAELRDELWRRGRDVNLVWAIERRYEGVFKR